MKRRAVLVPLVVMLVVVACTAVYFVLSGPAHRTVVLVDTSAPGTGLSQLGGAVRSVAGNSGDSDALSVRRFGGECGSPDATAEIADGPDRVAQAVGALSPSGKATMVDGVLAAIDDFRGLLTRRGSVRNRIIVISSTGVDACTNDLDSARKSVEDRLAEAGLDLDIRVVGFQVPPDRKEALAKFASNTSFADNADELEVVLDRLVVPNSPDAATRSINAAAAEPEPSYAFLTNGRLGIVRGTKVVAETTADHMAPGSLGFGYTGDGHFVFAVTSTGITTIDLRSGASRSVPCGSCRNAVSPGGSLIRWLAGNVVTTLDLADKNAQPVSGTTVLPDRKVGVGQSIRIQPLWIVAGKDGTSLVAAPDGVSAYGGPENLYLVRPGGQVVPLGATPGNVVVHGAAFSLDGRSLAYITAVHAGGCEERAFVVLIDLASGTQSETPVAGDPNDDGSGIDAVWYDKDGTLNMIYSSWLCAASGGPRTSVTIPESHWQLGNAGWTQREPGYARQIAPGFRAVLGPPNPQSNELFSEVNGTRVKILDGPVDIAVPN
ncbi:hypothetical protein AB0E59_17630 [Lentzea sp. NPDC034063]|uniref:hypothetical protein n=1 Tax=unclassified Lentzea TaxID=2643253 RepID=UPI00340FAD2D